MQQTTTTKRPQTQVRMMGSRCITFEVLYKELSGLTLVGIAAIMFALSFGYYFIKQHSYDNGSAKKP